MLLVAKVTPETKAQTAISSYNVTVVNPPNSTYSATAPSDAGNDINPGQTYDVSFGQGNDYTLNSYTIGGTTYSNFLEPDTLILQRTDGGRFVNIWYTLIDIDIPLLFGDTELILDGQEVDDADAIYQTGSLISGYDNILVNVDNQASGSIQAQVERVDAIWYTGIVSCAPSNAVFPVIERGGNDSIKIAAITALDSEGNPSAYSDLIEIIDSDWPGTGLSYDDFLILRRQTVGQNPLPLLNTGVIAGQSAQVIQGVAVSFSELGISAGQVIYGYSLFAYDTDDVSHDLTDISTFPTTTTAAASGLDLVAGVSAAVSSDNCLTVAIGPGGYKGALSTWLKANETADITTSTEGSVITDWQDHWTGNHDFVTNGTSPVYRSSTSTINFNQTADFTSTQRGLTTTNNFDFNDNGSSYENKSISLVFRTSSDISTRQVIYEQGDDTKGINLFIRNGSLFTHAWNRSNDGTGSPWNTTDNTSSIAISANTEYILTFELEGNSSITGTFRAYLNGQLIGSVSSVGLLFSHTGDINLGLSGTSQRYDDGSDSNPNSFLGELPEFIYSNEPANFNSTDRNKTESYLAIKYGVSLNQNTPIDYVNSSGSVIFNTTLNASLGGYLEYNQDIAGIGRDDNSELDQQQSKSENNGSIITFNKGSSFDNNNTWLIWGNDGGNANDLTTASDFPAIISNRIERIWRVAETGEAGSCDLIFDLNEITFNGSPSSSDLSLLIASSSSGGDLSNATIVSGGVINGTTLTFSGVNLENGEYFSLGTEYVDCAPGGVSSNLALWLRADLGPNTTSGEVTSWEDLANGNNATGSSGSVPDYLSNSINFNPALDFNDANAEQLNGSAGFNSTAYYIVLNTDLSYSSASTNDAVLEFEVPAGATDQFGSLLFGSATGAFTGEIVTHAIGGTGTRWRSGASESGFRAISSDETILINVRDNSGATGSEININGINEADLSSGTFLTSSNVAYSLGGNLASNALLDDNFNGQISEVISFSVRPSDTENARIQSYLALKYGITLDQSIAQNYVNTSGTTIWDANANASYSNDIAGIGRDDAACLAQKQSASSNAGSVITMGHGGIFSDNVSNTNNFSVDQSFLIWGDDGADPAQSNANTTDVPGNVTERLQTIWKVDQSGTVGEVSIAFDLSGLGYSTTASDFQLIISSSSTMANGTTITGGTIEGSVITFDNITFSDEDFFSLGTDRVNCAPGGVSTDLALWLKASEGTNTNTDGADISSWSDFSGSNRNGSITNLGGANPVAPTYEANLINWNPVIDFTDPNSTNAAYISTTNGNSVSGDFTLIAVFETGQSGGDTGDFENSPILIGAGTSGTDLDYGLGLAEGRLHLNAANDDNLTLRSTTGTTYIDFEPYLVTTTRTQSTGALAMFINSAANATATGSTNSFTNPTAFGIGNNPGGSVGSQYNGKIAEVLVFSDDLATTERQQVESYLAIKYGISRSTTDDYLASDGSTIWSYSSAGAYVNDITGIGRDDGSCLSQVKSTSENNDAIVTIEVNSFSADKSFLIWANDNASIEDPDNNEYNSAQVQSRLNREWYVQESGTTGTTTITFDISGITGPSGIGTNNLNQTRLMVDGDGDFSSGVTLYSPSSINSDDNTVSFQVDLNNGQYFTLGSEEVSALPIELVAFNARAIEDKNQVSIHWQTIDEQGQCLFEVERSKNGESFSSIISVEGNESPQNFYQVVDPNPLSQTSYYRLKFTDERGITEYSSIAAVYLENASVQQDVLYPNPVAYGEHVNIGLHDHEPNEQVFLEIYDIGGNLLFQEGKVVEPNHEQIKIPTDKLNKGINLIRLKCKNENKTYRLIIK
ncbi:T9SS type A sorting domain-containing protein [Roseivirga sp.]|uniref:T9SS type A sorting domain-containing protein n=1 Tax=Roseivirga sp. TaxID=1964215 RepID=UPI003B525ADA